MNVCFCLNFGYSNEWAFLLKFWVSTSSTVVITTSKANITDAGILKATKLFDTAVTVHCQCCVHLFR
jgi:hypothetical protein